MNYLIRPYTFDKCGMCGCEIDPNGDNFMGFSMRSNIPNEPVSPELGTCMYCASDVFMLMHRRAVQSGMSTSIIIKQRLDPDKDSTIVGNDGI